MPRNAAAQLPVDPLRGYAHAAFVTDSKRPVPLTATRISVRVDGGLATVTTERTFRNAEKESIEATMTFPAPVHATLLSLKAIVDGRVVIGTAQARRKARDTYEDALDRGKTAVLHEEALRGVHMISVGHVPPGREVTVVGTWAMPLSFDGSLATVRIPVTVGDVYGRSPLPESDALAHGGARQEADVEVSCKDGTATIAGGLLVEGRTRVVLDAPIDIAIRDWTPRLLRGTAADGRQVILDIRPARVGTMPIDAAVAMDRSGSMGCHASGEGATNGWGRGDTATKHQVVVASLGSEAAATRPGERIDLWEFSNDARKVAGRTFAAQVAALEGPGGGTAVGRSLETILEGRQTRDVLFLTDGKSFDLDVQEAARSGRRFQVILVGEDSLDAGLGHLAAMTGGQVFIVSGTDAGAAIKQAFAAMRLPRRGEDQVSGIETVLGGMLVRAGWGPEDDARIVGLSIPTMIGGPVADPVPVVTTAADDDAILSRSVAAVAAALAIPGLDEGAAMALAEAEGIVCHLTSLVLVDEEGEVQEGVPAQRKVATMTPRTAGMVSMSAAAFPMGAMRAGGMFRSAGGGAASKGILSASAVRNSFSTGSSGHVFGRGIQEMGRMRSGSWSPEPSRPGTSSRRPMNDLRDEMRRTALGLPEDAVLPEATRRLGNAPTWSANRPDLGAARGMIDWASSPEALRSGDLSGLSPVARLAILSACATVEVVALAAFLQTCVEAVAVALLARDEGTQNRTAARIARAVLGKATEADVAKAALAVGL